MADDALLLALAPLVVLGVVLLLGFTGCSFEAAVGSAPTLTIAARVPTALTVTHIQFAWESPSVPRASSVADNPSPAFVDGADNVFQHYVALPLTEAEPRVPVSETWTVRSQVTVEGGATPGPSANGMFTLDGSVTHPVATFQAMGGAADLTLAFRGVS